MIRFKNIVTCLMVMLLAYSPLSNASQISLPGIPDSGEPNFTNSAEINLFSLGSDNYLFAATNAGSPITFNMGSTSVSSTASNPGEFFLTALFSGDGTFKSGTLSIFGSIPYPFANLPGVYISGDLLTAKLENFAYDGDNLGFATTQLSGFGTLFGSAESVYLSATGIASALGFGSGALIPTSGPLSASAITTVPVPGAGWLIGSAFGLFTLLRKNRLTGETAASA